MTRLTQIAEHLAASVARTDTGDLTALADLHRQFEELHGHAGELHERSAGAVRAAATGAGKLLEQVILRETTDAERALQDVARHMSKLQELLGGTDAPAADSTPAAAEAAPVASNATHAAPAAPVALNADDAALVVEFIGEARSHIESAEAGVLRVEEHPDDLEAVNSIFRAFHTIKGVAGFLNLSDIGALAHAAENLLDLTRKGEMRLVGANVDVVLESIDLMKVLITRLETAMSSGTAPTADERLTPLIAKLHARASGKDVEPSAPVPEHTENATASAPSEAAGKPTGTAATTAEATVKVSMSRLDSLIDMVGELVIAESMVRQGMVAMTVEDQRLARNAAHLGKITRNLQDLSMSMRMVPIQATFQKMSRLVRDLGRKSGKRIELEMFGAETELDRNVVEAIADPLIHMIRNAADHGIEMPEDREKAGKPAAGRVELKAYHAAGNIVIEINDDGRGLRKDKILKKAIAAGIVKEGQQLADTEIFNLIFHAGLSTAEKLTDVSGRGVGMDVVKRNVEALRGQIDIRSTEGKGSTFSIRLPLTLAVIDGLAVRVGSERYLIPIASIEQSLRPRASQLSTVTDRGEMCMVRGRLLPLVRLYRLFGLTPRTEDVTEALVVIVQDNTRRCCLLVDELLGQQQVVIKSLGGGIGKIPGFSGGAILGDGNVSLILDVPGLIGVASGDE